MAEQRDYGLFDLLERFSDGERTEAVWSAAAGFAGVLRGARIGRLDRAALERELDAARREELAALLRHACFRTLHALPREKTLLVPTRNAEGRRWVESPAEWNARAAALEAYPDPRDAEALAKVRKARRGGFGGDPSASSLAWAAIQVRDEWKARIYLSKALGCEGKSERALQVAQELAARSLPGECRASAFLAVGCRQVSMGRLTQALLSYRTAANVGVAPIVSEFSWLTISLSLGHEDQALEAGRRLGDLSDNPEEVEDCMQVWRLARSSGALGVLSGGDPMLRRIEDRLPAIARMVAEMLFS